jgi:hypothetical protein
MGDVYEGEKKEFKLAGWKGGSSVLSTGRIID